MSDIHAIGPLARRRVLRHAAAAGAAIVVLVSGRAFAQAATAAAVNIDNFAFTPTPLSVRVGTEVAWLNRDDIPHSIVCPALALHSHPLDTGDQFSYRFAQPGVFDYMCGIHPHMRGQIVVMP